jgi:hypothetical protein
LHPYTDIPTLFGTDFGVLGHMLSWNDVHPKWCNYVMVEADILSQVVTSFILVPWEVWLLHLCKHSSHIEKAMCLTALARPRQVWLDWWDGKLGTGFFFSFWIEEGVDFTFHNNTSNSVEVKSTNAHPSISWRARM